MLRKIKAICLVTVITISLFEGAIATSFYFPKVWQLSPNPFIAQKLYRSQRNVVTVHPGVRAARRSIRIQKPTRALQIFKL